MRFFAPTLLVVACGSALLACGSQAADNGTVQTEVAATLTGVAALTPAATATPQPTPTQAALPARLWKSYTSGGPEAWWLENGTARQVMLPVVPGQYYDYNPVNGKILYASHFSTSGAGPGNLAVADLWTVDYPSGTPTSLITTDSVVEAMWTPDGSGVVYIAATPTTYELRYRPLSGEERVLASDVAPTWSVSRTGDYVAFTRESGYSLPGAPGLYVVPLAGGAEVKLSDTDRHGAGSIDDRPSWSFDDEWLALPNWGFAPGGMVIAARDGSASGTLTVEESLSVNPVFGTSPTAVIWHPDGQQLLGLANYSQGMGGPSPLVLYQLDPTRLHVVGGQVLGQGFTLIDWNVPGQSAYVVDENNQVSLVTLP